MLAIDKGALQREIDETGNQVAVPDRNLPQHQRNPRGRLQHPERLTHALVGPVDLVQKQEAGNTEIFEFAQDDLQLRQLALVGFAHHHGGIDRGKRRPHVVRELDRTRTIDEGVGFAHEGRSRGAETYAHLVMARLRTGVADAGSVIDAACFGDCARSGEDGFEKCGLAALEGAHQRNAPGTRALMT